MKHLNSFLVLLILVSTLMSALPANAQGWGECPEADSGLAIGDIATVNDADSSPLPLRRSPRLDASVLVNIPVRTELEIIDGPRCNDGWGWWKVEYHGRVGWVGEVGPEGLYNLLPPANSNSCLNLETHPVEIGDRARVTPGLSNRIRMEPNLESEEIGLARPGRTFRVLDGPVCADGFWWWQISYRGTVGWTVEGNEEEFWIERVP